MILKNTAFIFFIPYSSFLIPHSSHSETLTTVLVNGYYDKKQGHRNN